jgi:hypothetical protein
VTVALRLPYTPIKTSVATLEKEKTQNKSKSRKEEMKAITKLIAVAVATAAMFVTSSTLAQRNYDPKTVETVQGKVLSVGKLQQRGRGVHVMLQTDKETIAVHLGPSWYIDKQTPKIETNDTITVTGSRVTVGGKPAIIAAQVKKGNEVLKLRDDNGVPAWSRGRRGAQ